MHIPDDENLAAELLSTNSKRPPNASPVLKGHDVLGIGASVDNPT